MVLQRQCIVLQCSQRRCSWIPTVYSVYHTSKATYLQPQIDHHLYADDTQVYIPLSRADTYLSLKQLGDCLSDISGRMTNNKFRLNANKTNIIIIGISRQRTKLTHCLLPIKPFLLESLLFWHPSPNNSIHLVFTCCLFPGLRLKLELVLFQLLSLLFIIHSLNMLSHQIA